MYPDSSSKSEILNKQFQSVFTKRSTTATPRLFGDKYPSIENLSITLTLFDPWGVLKAPRPIFCSHAFNFGDALLCVGDFSQKIV